MDVTNLIKLCAFKNYLRVKTMPNRPKSYFKYLSAEVAKIVLVNQRLRWSSPLLFNDPFDVKRDFDLGFDMEEIKEPLTREVVDLVSRKETVDLSRDPRVAWLISHLRREDRTEVRDIIIRELPTLIAGGIQRAINYLPTINKQWSEFLPQLRILCLSAVQDDVLMWSHYSDSHRGVVLEFQPQDDSSFWWVSQPVRYQDAPPMLATKEEWVKSITGQRPLDAGDWRLYEPLTITKTKAWKYEEEWRVVTFMGKHESGLYSDYPFDPQSLRAVYLGCEIAKEDAEDVLSLLRYDLAHATVWRGRKVERERRVCFDRMAR
jgi:hypothetical protein